MIDLIEPEKRAHIESAARDAGASVSQLAQLRVLLEVSPFVAENITKQPDLWPFLLEQVNHANGPTGLAERIARQLADSPIEDLDRRLRDIRRAEMLRIAWRDVAGIAPTTETLRDLSDLAD
jgi:glutamate-ammonia-ligase adenylyltransferase